MLTMSSSVLDDLRNELRLRQRDLDILLEMFINKTGDIDTSRLLCATLCLAAYNKIEYLTRQIVWSTCDAITLTKKHYFNIEREIKKHLFSTAKKDNSQTNMERLFSLDACNFRPEGKHITNGNVDYQILKNILQTYKISIKWPPEPTINLDTLKDIRNQLAHGELAFSQINEYSTQDLKELTAYIESLSIAITDGLEISLNNSHFCLEK